MSYNPGPYGGENGMAGLLNRLINKKTISALGSLNGGALRGAANLLGPFGRGLNNAIPRGASANPNGVMGGAVGSGASELGQRLGSAFAGLGPQGQQQKDPLMELYNQLIDQLSAPVNAPTGVNTEDLMKQVQAALNPIYEDRENRAKKQSDAGRKEVEQMYRALSNDYERLAPQQAAQAQAAQEQIKQLYGQLRSNVEGTYSRVSKEQSELFKQLGIESALPDVMDEQNALQTEALNSINATQGQQEQQYIDQANTDATYYREGSPLSTMRGNEIRTDMLSQLADYLNQVEAERTSAIQSGYMDQLGQANNQLAQQQQNAQSEAGRRQEMLWQILQSQLKGNSNASPVDQFMAGLPQNIQQSVAGAFTRLQRSPEAVYGKTKDPRNPSAPFVETTPQWYMAQADEMLKNGQIDAATHQALLMYLQLQFAK